MLMMVILHVENDDSELLDLLVVKPLQCPEPPATVAQLNATTWESYALCIIGSIAFVCFADKASAIYT